MRISKKAEYALRALFAIARTAPAHLHQIQELSKAEAIPVKFLEQILLTLRHAGVLTSRRGIRGGYTFAKSPGQIRIGEVIRLMDGPLAPVPCASPTPSETCTCPEPQTCSLRILMTDVRNDLSALLDNRTIEDAVRAAQGPIEFQI